MASTPFDITPEKTAFRQALQEFDLEMRALVDDGQAVHMLRALTALLDHRKRAGECCRYPWRVWQGVKHED